MKPFMFTFGILGLNLNDPDIKYFDFAILVQENKFGRPDMSKNKKI